MTLTESTIGITTLYDHAAIEMIDKHGDSSDNAEKIGEREGAVMVNDRLSYMFIERNPLQNFNIYSFLIKSNTSDDTNMFLKSSETVALTAAL